MKTHAKGASLTIGLPTLGKERLKWDGGSFAKYEALYERCDLMGLRTSGQRFAGVADLVPKAKRPKCR